MPRFPEFASRTGLITGSVYEKFRARFAAQGDNMVALHIGDAYAPPPYDIPIDADFAQRNEGYHRYCDTFGVAALREALAAKLRADNALPSQPGDVLVTAGATNALAVTVQSLVDPGDDVMVLAPYWPFFRGMVKVAGGNPVEVPFYTNVAGMSQSAVRALLETHRTDRTVAVYLNSPNNPSGVVLTREQLQAVAEFVRAHDLWLISDEAYDGMVYDDNVHYSPGSFPEMFPRTISIFTFSKVYMFAGLRIGYATCERSVIEVLNKIMVHTLYSPSTVAQMMLVEPVRRRDQWRHAFVDHARELRDMFMSNLHVRPPTPQGAYYLFFPLTPYLRGRAYAEVIDACLDAGVSVAPGADFGADYERYIRICFTGEEPERLRVAVERLNGVFPA